MSVGVGSGWRGWEGPAAALHGGGTAQDAATCNAGAMTLAGVIRRLRPRPSKCRTALMAAHIDCPLCGCALRWGSGSVLPAGRQRASGSDVVSQAAMGYGEAALRVLRLTSAASRAVLAGSGSCDPSAGFAPRDLGAALPPGRKLCAVPPCSCCLASKPPA